MASTITVTPQELKRIAEELRQYNESYKRQLEEMVVIKNSLNTKWEGTAKEAFNKKFEERATLFDAFHVAIQGYISVLLSIAERYENVERRNAALVNGGGSSVVSDMESGFVTSNPFDHILCSVVYGTPVDACLEPIKLKKLETFDFKM